MQRSAMRTCGGALRRPGQWRCASFPSQYRMVIDGEESAAEGGRTFDVLNPASGEVLAQCPDCSSADVDRAVAAANAAFPSWSALPLEERKAYMRRAAEAVTPHLPMLAELLCKEQGKPKGGDAPHRKFIGATGELLGTMSNFKRAEGIEIPETLWQDMGSKEVIVAHRPLGVAAGIAPWNFPVLCLFMKVVPALVYGNTFVGKPSPMTPLTSLVMCQLLRDVLPKGVLNIVTSDDSRFRAGEALVNHKDVAKVSFTGSIPTGKAIMRNCVADMKRVTLELGGNDAAIVRGDCDPKAAARGVFAGAFANTGQVCTAVKRAYVHEDVYDEVVAELVCMANAAKMGDGMLDSTDYGPLNNEMQLNIVSELVEDARASGASIRAGGRRREGRGYFYEPTIITDVAEGVRIVDEEQFGPALPVIKYSDDEDALARANRTMYGLGGSVWSKDVVKANALASRLRAGTVWVNEHLGNTAAAPFGGFKSSGIGRENGDNLNTWTETQTFKRCKTA